MMIQEQSDNVLIVDHGSLYPALQRLVDRGFVEAEWGTSENNRKARFYTLTRKGRKELTREETEWRRIAAAIARILGPESEKA
jgi:PadR family transcriptional regulator, regulatory protein PadR